MITALVAVPLVVALLIGLLPPRSEIFARVFGCCTAALIFIAALVSQNAPDESHSWIVRPFIANLHVGLGSGIGFWLVLLTAVVTLSAIWAARVPRMPQFVALALALQGTMTGVFLARDLLTFALFWDLMLLPVFFVLNGWSGHTTAAWRYLIYNVVGGLALLLAVAAFGILHGTTDVIGRMGGNTLGSAWSAWIFAGLTFAFMVKTPVWPLHTWMPETYAELPSPMAAMVSAVQSKAGLYGLIVIGLPLFGGEFTSAAPVFVLLGMIGLLYGAVMALVQRDMKRVVAYSSLSHLGLIVVAIASQNTMALAGALLYLIGHGLFSAALFLVLGFVEIREDTRFIDRLGGLGKRNPRLAGAFIFAALAALGLPGLVGFAGELVILTGLFKAGMIWQSIVALVPIVLAAAYMLRLFQGVMQGPEIDDLPQRRDLRPFEILALAPLIAAIVALGVAPRVILDLPDAMAMRRPVQLDTSALSPAVLPAGIRVKGDLR